MHDETRDATVAWLRKAVRASGLTPTALARKAGIAPSTLLNPLNRADWHGNLNTTTIGKIAAAASVKPPSHAGLEAMAGFSEREVEPYDASLGLPAGSARLAENQDLWTVNTRALELIGFLPGDLIVVDLKAAPDAGDVVLVQHYGDEGGAQTHLRVFDRPFVMGRCTNPPKALLVDGKDVVILGKVIALHRTLTTA